MKSVRCSDRGDSRGALSGADSRSARARRRAVRADRRDRACAASLPVGSEPANPSVSGGRGDRTGDCGLQRVAVLSPPGRAAAGAFDTATLSDVTSDPARIDISRQRESLPWRQRGVSQWRSRTRAGRGSLRGDDIARMISMRKANRREQKRRGRAGMAPRPTGGGIRRASIAFCGVRWRATPRAGRDQKQKRRRRPPDHVAA